MSDPISPTGNETVTGTGEETDLQKMIPPAPEPGMLHMLGPMAWLQGDSGQWYESGPGEPWTPIPPPAGKPGGEG